MPNAFKPECSQEEFEQISQEADKAQYPVQYAKVKADALRKLLIDHAKLHELAKTGL